MWLWEKTRRKSQLMTSCTDIPEEKGRMSRRPEPGNLCVCVLMSPEGGMGEERSWRSAMKEEERGKREKVDLLLKKNVLNRVRVT